MGTMRALGLMSGTSMDAIDVAVIDTDGESAIAFGPHESYPYAPADRDLLRRAVADAVALTRRDLRPGRLAAAEAMITDRHAAAVAAFLSAQGFERGSFDIVGFHGHTELHRPEARLTVQIGDGAALAKTFGIPVAWDLRGDDVAAGGQGAPLVPVYHQALVARAGLEGPTVVINIGGVANLTFIRPGADPIACDTGPGNALLDDLMLERTAAPLDRDGAAAMAGQVDAACLAQLLAHPFFALPPPKSLDRDAFSRRAVAALGTADAAATLVAFTAAAIALAVERLPEQPRRAIICGGGGHNPAIMRALATRLPCPTMLASDLGWSLDAMEAQAFAYLAVRCARALPISFPGTTGAPVPTRGGRISRP
jgi:anhydro-N-acetylmuramic acid kinase